MAGQSLGLIETVGLGVAIEAADAAMKSANVDLVGYELTKGGGLVTVKLAGDVGAINAAVSAGVAAANRAGSVYAWKVIARTASGIDTLIASKETVGVTPPEPVAAPEELAQKSQTEQAIPVVNIEVLESGSDCLVLSEEIVFTSPETPATSEGEPQQPVEKPAVQQEAKPVKPRSKGSKR